MASSMTLLFTLSLAVAAVLALMGTTHVEADPGSDGWGSCFPTVWCLPVAVISEDGRKETIVRKLHYPNGRILVIDESKVALGNKLHGKGSHHYHSGLGIVMGEHRPGEKFPLHLFDPLSDDPETVVEATTVAVEREEAEEESVVAAASVAEGEKKKEETE